MFDLHGEHRRNQTAARTFEVIFYCTNRPRNSLTSRRVHTALTAVGIGLALLTAAGGYLYLRRRGQSAALRALEPEVELPVPEGAEETVCLPLPEPPQQVVMVRYDDGEVDRFLHLVPETGRLTGREMEVLREILHGKKQGEIAYYLGIEVSTVKDFYRKIYDKLGVPNKDGLFRMVSDQLHAG